MPKSYICTQILHLWFHLIPASRIWSFPECHVYHMVQRLCWDKFVSFSTGSSKFIVLVYTFSGLWVFLPKGICFWVYREFLFLQFEWHLVCLNLWIGTNKPIGICTSFFLVSGFFCGGEWFWVNTQEWALLSIMANLNGSNEPLFKLTKFSFH